MPIDPTSKPSRQKGPIVWLDMDQKELDDAYDQAVYAPNQLKVQTRRDVSTARAREALGTPQRLKYGTPEIEGLDLFRAKTPDAPVVVYIHGGAWRRGVSADNHTPAEMFVHAGAHYLAADFSNIDDHKGDLLPMVDQVRRAVAWTWKNAQKFGGDSQKLYVIGHSSGAHLTSCIITTDWAKDYGLPADIIAGSLTCSGMYDLTPVRLSKRSEYVKFTDATVEKLSAMRHLDRINMPLVVGYGTDETPEFQRQAREFAAALQAAGKPHELVVGPGYNHFEIAETISNPYGLIGRRVLRMMGLGPG
jgi:arylformamidase